MSLNQLSKKDLIIALENNLCGRFSFFQKRSKYEKGTAQKGANKGNSTSKNFHLHNYKELLYK